MSGAFLRPVARMTPLGHLTGVPIKVVSERLGHATTARTLNTYTHVLPAQDHEAALAIQRAMRGQRRPPGTRP